MIAKVVNTSKNTSPNLLGRDFGPLMLLVALWLVLHIPSVWRLEVWSQWEICEARKLLDYGFFRRGGALLEPALDSGRLAFPEDLNYTHHPHPMVWWYTALFAVGGPWLCVAFMLTLRLAATLVLFRLLRRFFSVHSSWWATLLFMIAPATVIMDVETNIIGIAAAYWPFAAWLALRAQETGRHHFVLGLFVFWAGQTSWLFLTLLPALIWLAAPPGIPWTQMIRRPFSLPSSRAILIGGGLSFLAFLCQLIWYTPDWPDVFHYLRVQMGFGRFTVVEETPRWKMAILALLRNAYYIGAGLCLGVAGWAACRKRAPASRLVGASLIFIACFVLVEIALLRFCFIEISPYLYLLVPFTILTAATLETMKSRALFFLMIGSSFLTYGYFAIRYASSNRSAVVAPLATVFAEATQVNQIILTNMKHHHPPFAPWDNFSPDLVRREADRAVFYWVQNRDDFESLRPKLKRNFQNVVFAFTPAQPIDPSFLEWLRTEGKKYYSTSLDLPVDSPDLAAKIRLKIWELSGRFSDRAPVSESTTQHTSFEFYRMPF